jgi:hypothetical protein
MDTVGGTDERETASAEVHAALDLMPGWVTGELIVNWADSPL